MKRLSWNRLRESTAASSAPALLRGQTGDPRDIDDDGDIDIRNEGGGDGDADDQTCTTCDGAGIANGMLCAECGGSGSVMKESTSGDYWVYSDDPEWEVLREANRTFSSDVRKKYAGSGVAMSDGSYPIPDKDALRRAILSYGHNPTDAVKAHIIKRAKALGASDQLPEDWKPTKEGASVADRLEALESRVEYGEHTLKLIREAKATQMTPTFSTPVRIKTADGNHEGYQVVLIREGRGNAVDDQWYTGDAIREMCESGVCEGMQAFGNHPTEDEEDSRPERDVKELVGSYHDVKFAESNGKARAEAIFVPLTLDENHPRYGWIVTLAEAASRNNSPQPICGISLYGLSAGDDGDRPDGTHGRIVSMIRPMSGDIVTNAGAGGGFIRQLMESARALRNRSGKEHDPMKLMAYQNAVREAVKRVREADSDETREAAMAELTKLESESIDSVPDTIEALTEAAPKLVTQLQEAAAADAATTVAEMTKQLKEAQATISQFTDAIGITKALHEADVSDPVELRYFAGKARQEGLSDAADIKAMVETERAYNEAREAAAIAKIQESLGDIDFGIEGAGGRIPVSVSLPDDGGVKALREAGIPTLDAE